MVNAAKACSSAAGSSRTIDANSGCFLCRFQSALGPVTGPYRKKFVDWTKALQPKKLETCSAPEMLKNAAFLAVQGVVLAVENKLGIARRVATVALAENDVNTWLRVLSLTQVPEWDAMNASFGSVLAELKNGKSEDHKQFQETFVDTVFCSPFIKQLNKLNEANGNGSDFIGMATKLVQMLTRDMESIDAGDEELAVVGKVMQAVRGTLCLCAPQPLDRASALEDVQYIAPKNSSTAGIINDLPKVGRLLVSRFRAEVCVKTMADCC
eukprot:6481030-Amphidinium_carterae.4